MNIRCYANLMHVIYQKRGSKSDSLVNTLEDSKYITQR